MWWCLVYWTKWDHFCGNIWYIDRIRHFVPLTKKFYKLSPIHARLSPNRDACPICASQLQNLQWNSIWRCSHFVEMTAMVIDITFALKHKQNWVKYRDLWINMKSTWNTRRIVGKTTSLHVEKCCIWSPTHLNNIADSSTDLFMFTIWYSLSANYLTVRHRQILTFHPKNCPASQVCWLCITRKPILLRSPFSQPSYELNFIFLAPSCQFRWGV